MSRRMARVEAQAWLEAEVAANLGPDAMLNGYSPRMLARAIQESEGVINRAARRALGYRSDGRFHPLACMKAMVRTRNAA
jgi:hypothetical protein